VGRLLLVRHAQSVWNAAGRWQGWSDAPLSPLGIEQARRAGQVLAATSVRPGLMACSDLARARSTAELIAAELGYDHDLIVDADLREQDLGEWNGLTGDEIMARWPGELEARRQGKMSAVPGGEAGDHFVERAVAAVRRVAAMGADETIVVSHGGVVMAMERLLGIWGRSEHHNNLSGWWLESREPPDDELVPLAWVDLLVAAQNRDVTEITSETVTGTA
jgi:glucosyl-3-phosphoglycerate phosphatase